MSRSILSHFGPPTAPSSTASAARARSRVSSARGTPCLSMAAPPITSWLNSKPRLYLVLATSRTLTASAMISGPIPSPGRIRICLLMLSSFHLATRPQAGREKLLAFGPNNQHVSAEGAVGLNLEIIAHFLAHRLLQRQDRSA